MAFFQVHRLSSLTSRLHISPDKTSRLLRSNISVSVGSCREASAWSRCLTLGSVGSDTRQAPRNGRSVHTHGQTEERDTSYVKYGVVAAFVGFVGFGIYRRNQRNTECQEKKQTLAIEGGHKNIDVSSFESKGLVKQDAAIKRGPGEFRADLPTFTKADVSAHKTTQTGIWVTFGNGVYDITSFVEQHPGGNKILLAAGGSLEPFWTLYAVHKNEEVFEMLEGLRIGNIKVSQEERSQRNANDPYANDPDRHPAMKINSAKPFNAEPPEALLSDSLVTPNELFFVRNHLPVPEVDEKNYSLEVDGIGVSRKVSLKLEDLKKRFKTRTVMATLQCAGNRRSDMNKTKKVKGLSWTGTAISNAEWTGVLLCDVLKAAGVSEDNPEIKHVHFEGLDADPAGEKYGASIPIEIAMDPKREVLLAYQMNGEELPKDHGHPIRVVVPGVVGARNVKWLKTIKLSKEESPSHWQQKDYKGFGPSEDWDTADFKKAVSIQDYPIQSAILQPEEGETLPDGDEVTVKGYAWSGGGRGIIRVDVSVDGGKTWHKAELQQAEQSLYKQWAWTLWEATIPVPAEHSGKLDLCCKAVDTSYNVQPEQADGIWNIRGLLHNAWHRVHVSVPKEE